MIKDSHTAWSNACPARKKETERIKQAKDARSIYWHVPLKDSTTEQGTRPMCSAREEDDNTGEPAVTGNNQQSDQTQDPPSAISPMVYQEH